MTGLNITKRLVLTVAFEMNRDVKKKRKKVFNIKKTSKIFLKRQKEITYQYEVGIYASILFFLGMFDCVSVQSVAWCRAVLV